MNGITKETFQAADKQTQLSILFDYQKGTNTTTAEILELMREHPKGCEDRFKKLEKKQPVNTVVAGGLGFLGGFVAMAAKLKFWGP